MLVFGSIYGVVIIACVLAAWYGLYVVSGLGFVVCELVARGFVGWLFML